MPEKYEIVWTKRGANSLVRIVEYLENESSQRLDNLQIEIKKVIEQIRLLPFSGQLYRKTRHTEVRETQVFNYRLFYRVVEKTGSIEILLLHHAARREPRRLD